MEQSYPKNNFDTMINKRIENTNEYSKKIIEKFDHVSTNPDLMSKLKREINEFILDLKDSHKNSMYKVWIHIDFDMFYAAVESLFDPNLANVPFAVGSLKGVLSTCNQLAREQGCKSGMAGFKAKELCPNLIFVDHHFERQLKQSTIFKDIMREIDTKVESMGLDECYIEVYDQIKNYQSVVNQKTVDLFTNELIEKIQNATNLSVSCGVGPNKMISKMCTSINKPKGKFILDYFDKSIEDFFEVIEEFMCDKKVGKVPNVGRQSTRLLNNLEIYEIKDCKDQMPQLYYSLSKNFFDFILKVSYGLQNYEHNEQTGVNNTKSVSKESTEICKDQTTFRAVLIAQSKFAQDSWEKNHSDRPPKSVGIYYKDSKFEVKQVTHSCQDYIQNRQEFDKVVFDLLPELLKNFSFKQMHIRLVGVRMFNLKKTKELIELTNKLKCQKSITEFNLKRSKCATPRSDSEDHETNSIGRIGSKFNSNASSYTKLFVTNKKTRKEYEASSGNSTAIKDRKKKNKKYLCDTKFEDITKQFNMRN